MNGYSNPGSGNTTGGCAQDTIHAKITPFVTAAIP